MATKLIFKRLSQIMESDDTTARKRRLLVTTIGYAASGFKTT